MASWAPAVPSAGMLFLSHSLEQLPCRILPPLTTLTMPDLYYMHAQGDPVSSECMVLFE